MASILKVDALQGVTAAGDITITSDTGVTTVLQLGIATHAVHYNQKTPAIVKSWNTSSVSDNAAGDFTVSITNAYSDINSIYTVSCNFNANSQADQQNNGQLHRINISGVEQAPTTTTYRVNTDNSATANTDLKYDYTTIHGDLA